MLRKTEGREGDDRGGDGWMASPITGHDFKHAPGDGEEQGSLLCSYSWDCKDLDMT